MALGSPRTSFKPGDYAKMRIALEQVDELIKKVEAVEEAHEALRLSAEQRRFLDAYKEHWVHADNRVTMTSYICRLLVDALQG